MLAPKKTCFISCDIENYVDNKVYNDITKTYAKECITLMDYGLVSINSVDNTAISQVQFSECEISPFHKSDIPCHAFEPASFQRQTSLSQFSKQTLDFDILQNWLIHTFSPNKNGQRPYPSAGGLYPIEPLIFIFDEKIKSETSFISGCYHFRPISKVLQFIKPLAENYFYDILLHGLIEPEKRPLFCILYTAHIGKSIFKYRYRGYRHALMEVGSMYQHATLTSQAIGLRNSVWSSFSEYEFLAALELDPAAFMPLMMQFFGTAK